MAKTKLSLIICTKDRAASLRRCLDALDTQELAEVSGEVVLVDNGSTDDTAEVINAFTEKAQCPVRLVSEEKPGLGRARNTGIASATGKVLVFTDDDCYLASDYVRKTSAIFKEGRFHYCGGRILLHDPSDAKLGCNYQETFELIPSHSFVPAGKIQGTSMVVHRSVFDSIGGFDPEIGAGTPFPFEDIDMCARASMAGFNGAHVPELVVYHHHGRKPGREAAKHREGYDFGRGAYYAKLALMGEFQFLRFWTREIWERQRTTYKKPRASLRKLSKTGREMRGAARYLQSRAFADPRRKK